MTNNDTVRENSPEGERTDDDSQPDWEALGHELLMGLLWHRRQAVNDAAASIDNSLRDGELDPKDVKQFRSAVRELYIYVNSDLVRATPGIDHSTEVLGQ